MPDAAITTDLIVGFPGETEADFAETLRVVEASRFASAFTFQYSPRPGTPAASLGDQVPHEVVQERYERLMALQDRVSGEESAAQVGRTVEVLVTEGAGRKDDASHRLTGRAADNRLVHLALPLDVAAARAALDGDDRLDEPLDPRVPRPGDVVTVRVTHSAPYHLVADSALATDEATSIYSVRRTRAGDAWAARERDRAGLGGDHAHGAGTGAASAGGPVVLGIPAVRKG